MNSRNILLGACTLAILAFSGCISVPSEIVQLHQKEMDIANELQRTHLALVDSYVDERLLVFEDFYFNEYGPKYLANWKAAFKSVKGREYDETTDFGTLHPDLVVEYQEKTKPIEDLRAQLKDSVKAAYAQFQQSHAGTHAWLLSAKKLDKQRRASTNRLLAAVKPDLSLESIDRKIAEIQNQLNPN